MLEGPVEFFSRDLFWMKKALEQAERGARQKEVPVGAVLIQKEHLIAASHNLTIERCDPTAHAEIVVLREAAQKLQAKRLLGITAYVTLEPCPMCLWAMVQAHIQRLVFAAYDSRVGAAGTAFNLLPIAYPIWRFDVIGGVCSKQASQLLQSFFEKRRLNLS